MLHDAPVACPPAGCLADRWLRCSVSAARAAACCCCVSAGQLPLFTPRPDAFPFLLTHAAAAARGTASMEKGGHFTRGSAQSSSDAADPPQASGAAAWFAASLAALPPAIQQHTTAMAAPHHGAAGNNSPSAAEAAEEGQRYTLAQRTLSLEMTLHEAYVRQVVLWVLLVAYEAEGQALRQRKKGSNTTEK